MGRASSGLSRAVRHIGWYWASLLGDNHYHRYLEYRRRAHPGEPVLSERDYWRRRHRSDPGGRCC